MLNDDKETQHGFREMHKCHGEIQHNHKVLCLLRLSALT